MTEKVTREMTTKKAIKEVQRLGPLVERLMERMMWAERGLRILLDEHRRGHVDEITLKNMARKRNMLDNSFREIKRHLKTNGNEFDREPYMEDPE